jgi:BMFP domain-containing protein YqiC
MSMRKVLDHRAKSCNRQKFRKKYIKLFNELDAVAKKDFQAVKQVNYSPALKRF